METSIIKSQFRKYNSESFVEKLTNSSNKAYLFFAQGAPWVGEEIPVDNPLTASTIPSVSDSLEDENNIRATILALKRIAPSNIRFGIKRYTWELNTVFSVYDDEVSLISLPFYAVTDEGKVYKCILNGNDAPSTIKPTHTDVSLTYPLVPSADGYVWKFMYQLSDDDLLMFPETFLISNPDQYWITKYIPTKHLIVDDDSLQWDVQQAAIAGTIDKIVVVSGSTGYGQLTTMVQISGDGTGATAEVVLGVNGVISSVVVTNPGSGYTKATVTILDTSGVIRVIPDAVCRAIVSPKNGHGSNPIEELFGVYVLINEVFDSDEGGVFPIIDYRKLGILINPKYNDSDSNNIGLELTVSFDVSIANNNFKIGEAVDLSPDPGILFTPTVTFWDPISQKLILTGDSVTGFIQGSTLTGTQSGFESTIISAKLSTIPVNVDAIEGDDIDKYSGELTYIEQREVVYRSLSQQEFIDVLVHFADGAV